MINRRRFAELWLSGIPAPQIAKELGISSADYARVLAQRWGLPKRRDSKGGISDLAQFRIDYRRGMTIKALCEKYGVSDTTVYLTARKLELPYRSVWHHLPKS